MKQLLSTVKFILMAGAVSADTFNLTAIERGWVCSNTTTCSGTNNGADPTNIYAAGVFVNTDLRDWFEFSIPTLTGGPLVSATLNLAEGSAGHNGGTLTFSVYGLSAQPMVFTDVTTSNPFGSVATSNADNGTTVSITLNAAALSAIAADQGGNIFIGGIDSGENVATPGADFLGTAFVSSKLNLTTPGSAAVPEPSSLPFFGAVLFAAIWGGTSRAIRAQRNQ